MKISSKQKQKNILWQKWIFVTEKSVCHQNKFQSDKYFWKRKQIGQKTSLDHRYKWVIQVSVIETNYGQRKKVFCHIKQLFSPQNKSCKKKNFHQRKKLPLQRQVHRNIMYQNIVLSSSEWKYVKKNKKYRHKYFTVLVPNSKTKIHAL